VSDLNWLEVCDDWKVDGGLRDVHVFSASEADWQRLLDVVSRQGWASSYSEDGEPVPMPAEVGRIFEHMKTRSVLWEIRPTSEIKINCFFFSPDEIDFDIDPREIVGQSQLDAVCEFVRVVGKALDKPVAVTWEGESAREAAFMRYEPETDAILRVDAAV
jgi:hypothetical protein